MKLKEAVQKGFVALRKLSARPELAHDAVLVAAVTRSMVAAIFSIFNRGRVRRLAVALRQMRMPFSIGRSAAKCNLK